MLEAEGIARQSGPTRLLEDVSLVVRGGDRVGLVGPSGSGKTVLLRTMALLDPPQAGEVRWKGVRVEGDAVPPFRREVIYVHQRPVLVSEASVAANLRLPFELSASRGRRFDRARVLRWLSVLGRASDFMDRSARVLSGGEAHLVAILRALELDPSVLLLDEPAAALDRPTSASLERLLEDWLDEDDSRALVWIGHDRAQVDRVSRRIVSMRGGRLENA
jgi:putative ABC transport system ATP-binding protein